jgi:hypothetical protein
MYLVETKCFLYINNLVWPDGFGKKLRTAHPHVNICRLVLFLTALRFRCTVTLTSESDGAQGKGLTYYAEIRLLEPKKLNT